MQQSEMLLFVYGSLTDGMVHFDKLKPYVVEKKNAKYLGFAYRTPVGYPVLLNTNAQGTLDGAQWIEGQLLTLSAPDLFYRILDEYYGYSPFTPDKSLHWKEKTEVQCETGDTINCSIYLMNPSKLPKGSSYIEDGNWRKSLDLQPPLMNELTEKQVTYIKRLSQSSGREIVPIDLNLYRELLKLELIVDKGRRLALTKLGKEVARHLV